MRLPFFAPLARWQRLSVLAALLLAAAALMAVLFQEDAARAQTADCSIALSVTSPAERRIEGEWTTSNCGATKGEYQWKMQSELAWKGSHRTSSTDGTPNRFAKKDLTPGFYEFRAVTDPPTPGRVAVVSRAGSDNTYGADDYIRVRVTFSQPVTVTGSPQIDIDMDPAHWGTKQASYESGSGSRSLIFAHRVVHPNLSTQGVAVLENSLTLNGGTIRRGDGTDADLRHPGLGHNGNHKVNWELPSDGNNTIQDGPVYSDTVTVVVEPVAGRPRGVQMHPGEYLSLQVSWDEHSGPLPSGTSLSGYFVEWAKDGETQYSRTNLLPHNAGYLETPTLSRGKLGHNLYWLEEGAFYTVRVVAQFTDSANNTTEVVSKSIRARAEYREPMLAWWIDDTPNANLSIRRIFMMTDSNKVQTSAVCIINGGRINCPPRTLVSLDFSLAAGSVYNIKAETTDNREAFTTSSIVVDRNGVTGCRPPTEGIRLSGSSNKLVVWWGSDVNCQSYSGPVSKWKLKHWKPDGMGGTTLETIELPASQQTHTFENQLTGDHEIQVIPVSLADHDFSEIQDQTISPSDCTTAGDDGCTVSPTARRAVDGMGQKFSTVLDAGFTEVPGLVTTPTATAGTESIALSWGRPRDSRYYFGIEGKGPTGALHESAKSPVYRYDIRYRRSEIGGVAPGRWKEISAYPWYVGSIFNPNPRQAEITGLEDGLGYDVEIRAVNAVGPGNWSTVANALQVK